MQLLDLPNELLQAIAEQILLDLPLNTDYPGSSIVRGAHRLRFVNKIFDTIISHAFFTTGRMRLWPCDDDWRSPRCKSFPMIPRYLSWRVRHDKQGFCDITSVIQRIAPSLVHSGYDIDIALQHLCSALIAHRGEFLVLLSLEPRAHFDLESIEKLPDDDRAHLLSVAAYIGDESLIKSLIASGQDVDCPSVYFGTALKAASRRGHSRMFSYIRQRSNYGNVPHPPMMEDGQWQWRPSIASSPLEAAALGGHLDIVRALWLREGKPPSLVGLLCVLQTAAFGGHVDVIKFLMETDPNIAALTTIDGFYPQPWGEKRTESDAAFIKKKIMLIGIERGHLGVVQAMLDEGVSPSLHAVSGGDDLSTILDDASFHGHLDIVALLLKHGAPINTYDQYHYFESRLVIHFPLADAVRGGSLQMVKFLIDHGAEIDTGYKTPIEHAARTQNFPILRLLLQKVPKPRNWSHDGNSLSSFLGSPDGQDLYTLKFLVDAGLDVHGDEAKNDVDLLRRQSPLHLALEYGHDEAVKFLEDHGVRPILYKDGKFSWKSLG